MKKMEEKNSNIHMKVETKDSKTLRKQE